MAKSYILGFAVEKADDPAHTHYWDADAMRTIDEDETGHIHYGIVETRQHEVPDPYIRMTSAFYVGFALNDDKDPNGPAHRHTIHLKGPS